MNNPNLHDCIRQLKAIIGKLDIVSSNVGGVISWVEAGIDDPKAFSPDAAKLMLTLLKHTQEVLDPLLKDELLSQIS